MQLILIVQVSIALLAGELTGLLPIGPWAGLLIAIAGPMFALVHGVVLSWNAHRLMDRASRAGVEALYRSNGWMGWVVTGTMALAACSDLARAAEPTIGFIGVSVLLMGLAITATLTTYATTWSVEKRLRESSLMRALDGMAPLHPMPSRSAFVLMQARAGLVPMLVPLLVPIVMSEALRALALRFDPDLAEPARFTGALAGTVLLFVMVPLLVPPLLGLRRLAPGPMRDDLEELAKGAGVGVREIWVWPTEGLIANAAVMGAIPGLRCVMLSDCLLECMPREQVRAVMAHELGHVVRRHLPWMLVVIIGCWTLAGAMVTPIAQFIYERAVSESSEASVAGITQAAALARDACVLGLGLVAFGFASRRFERQADTYAVQLLSAGAPTQSETGVVATGVVATGAAVDAMAGALGTVALLNNVAPTRSSWRHGSIAWRQDYLRTLTGSDCDAMSIDRLVVAMRWIAAAVIGVELARGFFPL